MRKINLWFTGYRSNISILDYYVCSIWRVYDNVFNWIWYTIIDEIIYCFLFTNQIWNWTTYCMSLMVTIVLVVGALLVNFWIVGCSMMVCFMNINYVMNFQPDPLRKKAREEEKIKLPSLPLLFSAPFQWGVEILGKIYFQLYRLRTGILDLLLIVYMWRIHVYKSSIEIVELDGSGWYMKYT